MVGITDILHAMLSCPQVFDMNPHDLTPKYCHIVKEAMTTNHKRKLLTG
jgi:hypothetical protein